MSPRAPGSGDRTDSAARSCNTLPSARPIQPSSTAGSRRACCYLREPRVPRQHSVRRGRVRLHPGASPGSRRDDPGSFCGMNEEVAVHPATIRGVAVERAAQPPLIPNCVEPSGCATARMGPPLVGNYPTTRTGFTHSAESGGKPQPDPADDRRPGANGARCAGPRHSPRRITNPGNGS